MTDNEAHTAYLDEMTEIALATQDQIDRLCEMLGNDGPQRAFDSATEELNCLMAGAMAEFA